MKAIKIRCAALAALTAVCMFTAGCAGSDTSSVQNADTNVSTSAGTASEENDQSSESAKNDKQSNPAGAKAGADNTATSEDNRVLDTGDMFSDRDLEQSADLDGAKKLTLADSQTAEITEEGVYVLSGSVKNSTVKVAADKEAKVQLVLDGVSITNDSVPAIYVTSADKVFITTASGSSNTLSVTGDFTADGDTNTDAVIFSKDDIVLNGEGSLTVTSAKGNGITGKDDVKFTGGTYSITSALDAVEANDSLRISGGSYTVDSGKDGFHCENGDDDTVGWIYISGGTFNITASSDAIQGTTLTQIDGGTFTLKGAEGIESTCVRINGGDITITASDDGVNGSKKSSSYGTPFFEMNDGKLTITMGSGDTDAIDVNGNVTVNGGTIDITCPQQGSAESFDYDGTASFNGGTIIINGQQVDSIPTPMMMGGGGRGGFGGKGNWGRSEESNDMGGFGGQEPPEGFDTGNMPEGFGKQLPENFDTENMPEGFGKRQQPENFDPENLPEGFEENFKGRGRMGRRNAEMTSESEPNT